MFRRLKDGEYKGANEKLDVHYVSRKLTNSINIFLAQKKFENETFLEFCQRMIKNKYKMRLKNFDSKQAKRVVLKQPKTKIFKSKKRDFR